MMKNIDDIIIQEKDDTLSWDEIQQCIWNAHSENRDKGIIMGNPSLSANEIRKRIENNGKMLVALINGKVVGTAAVDRKRVSLWCSNKNEEYAHICFDSVLSEYNGCGIFKLLDIKREKMILEMGLDKIIGDTHEYNYKRLEIAKKNGYKFVDYKFCKDHFNIVLVKWLHGYPYSDLMCSLMYKYNKLKREIKYKWLKKN